MPNTGWKFPTNASEDASGVDDWIDETRIEADDGTKAYAPGLENDDDSNIIYGYQFGFAVPVAADITGVEVEIERSRSADVPPLYKQKRLAGIWLMVGSSTIGNDNKGGDTADWVQDPNWEIKTYGDSLDLWGAVLTPAIVNSNNFGVGVRAEGYNGSRFGWAGLDYIKCKIYYEPAKPEFKAQVIV